MLIGRAEVSDAAEVTAHELLDQKYLTLTGFGMDGAPRQVAVFVVPDGNDLLTLVGAALASSLSGPVTVAACSARCRPIGREHFAETTPLTEAECVLARARIVHRYGVVPRNLTARRPDLVGLRIHLLAGKARHTLPFAA